MSVDLRTIDEIVQKVMDQLRSGAPAPSSAPAPVAVASVPKPSSPADDRLVLAAHVITGPLLESQLGNRTILVVPPKAIITPTAQDIIRQREIRLVRETVAGSNVSSRGKWKLLLSDATPEAQRAAEDLLSRGELAGREIVACTQDAVRQAVTALTRAEVEGIVGLVKEPIRAAAQSNQHLRIRSAAVNSTAILDAARSELSPNLIWINPRQRSWFELKTLLSACVSGPRPAPPKGWKD